MCQVKPGQTGLSGNINSTNLHVSLIGFLPTVLLGIKIYDVGSGFSQLCFSSSLCSTCGWNPCTKITVTGSSASPCRSVSTQLLHSLSHMLLWLELKPLRCHPFTPNCWAKFNLLLSPAPPGPSSTLHQHIYHSEQFIARLFYYITQLEEAFLLIVAF